MSGAPELERSVLERKERGELHVIAESLGMKPTSRTKKSDLIDQILTATGVDTPPVNGRRANGFGGADRDEQVEREQVADDRPPVPAGEPSRSAPGSSPVAVPTTPAARLPIPGPPSTLQVGSDSDSHPTAHSPAVVAAPLTTALTEAPQPRPPTGRGPAPDRAPAPDRLASDRGLATDRGFDRRPTDDTETGDNDRNAADREPAADRGPSTDRAVAYDRGGPQGLAGQRSPGHQGQNAQSSQNPQRGNAAVSEGDGGRRRRRRGRDRQGPERDLVAAERAAVAGEPQFSGEPIPVRGFLDLRDDGFGFVRCSGFTASPHDVYVASVQVKRFGLRKGDFIEGLSRPAGSGEKFPALLRIDQVGGMGVEEARQRRRFEDLTPLFPDHRLKMETPGDPTNITARIVDLMCPIGKGQRGLIVSPPKAGKTTVIKQIAKSIEENNPEVHLIVLLVDERPEEVTDMRRTVKGEVIASTFDRPSEEHTQVAELALERAKRLVELGRDVVIILDGITRLTRAYNLSAPASGRLTSGGIDQAAIYPPKKFFGAARNAEEGGSLTILATALVETGSKADDVIFEELKGTGNMELRLDRRLAERRLYPAIDVNASSTRHEELLFDRGQLQLVWRLRRVLNALSEDGSSWKSLELLMEKIRSTRTNDEFLAEVAKTQMPV